MPRRDRSSQPGERHLVEISRVAPIEADLLVARLRASGIDAVHGPLSPYASVSFADGIAVLVPSDQESEAIALLAPDD